MIDLFEKLKRAKVFQVLAFYLGASWIILQVVDVLQESLSLPEWVAPVSVILLLIGLIIIAATAMLQAQANPGAGRIEGVASEGPVAAGASDVPVSDAGTAAQLFTWKRSLAGGALAFIGLFVAAGITMTLGGGPGLGPEEISADEAGVGVAVLPFTVTGQDMAVWAEGMVDLLSDNLDGTGSLRAIDPRTVMSRWHGRVAEDERPDLPEMLDIARSTGARYAVVGSAVSLGGTVRLTTDIYDIPSGQPMGSGAVEGRAEDVMILVDGLSVQTASAVLASSGGPALALRHTTSMTTQSPVALRAYLEGEALYRTADFAGATDAFRRAVVEDSTFALANLRLSRAIGWLRNIGDSEAEEALVAAMAFRDRLPPREAELLDVEQLLETQDFGAVSKAASAARNYPDDAEAWELLGEAYAHQGDQALVSIEEALEPFDKAIEIDPTFSPIYFHPIEFASALGDSERVFGYLEALDRASFDDGRGGRYDIFAKLSFGDEPTRQEALARVRSEVPDRELVTGYFYGFKRTPESRQADLLIASEMSRRGMAVQAVALEQSVRLSEGRLDEALGLAFDAALDDAGVTRAAMLLQWSAWAEAPDDPRVRDLIAIDGCGAVACTAQAVLAADLGDWDRHSAIVEEHERMVEERLAEARTGDPVEAAPQIARLEQELLWVEVGRTYGQMRRGETSGIPRAFQQARTTTPYANWPINGRNQALRWWIAELLLEQGQAEQAARYYQSLWGAPQGAWYTIRLVGLGDAMRALGRDDEAREYYSDFLEAWSDADEEHPFVQRARSGLAAL